MRRLTDRALRVAGWAEGAAVSLALVVVAVCLGTALGLTAAPSWLLWVGLAAVVALYLLGHAADVELQRREHEAGHEALDGYET